MCKIRIRKTLKGWISEQSYKTFFGFVKWKPFDTYAGSKEAYPFSDYGDCERSAILKLANQIRVSSILVNSLPHEYMKRVFEIESLQEKIKFVHRNRHPKI